MERQWITSCPGCGAKDRLIVTSVLLSATGETLHINSKLDPDGFGFEYDGKDASTEDELVLCTACLRRYYLEDLSIEKENGYRSVKKTDSSILSPREQATTLYALSQLKRNISSMLSSICKISFTLSVDEIDDLCERLNLGNTYILQDSKVYIVTTITEDDMMGDILLVTWDETQAERLVSKYNSGEKIQGIDRDALSENSGKAGYFARVLGSTLNNENA